VAAAVNNGGITRRSHRVADPAFVSVQNAT